MLDMLPELTALTLKYRVRLIGAAMVPDDDPSGQYFAMVADDNPSGSYKVDPNNPGEGEGIMVEWVAPADSAGRTR